MDDHFTQSAQRALALASEEARSLGHSYIGTEHLLLGLLKEGAVIEVLGFLSIAPNKVREQVICVVGSKEAVTRDRRPLTPRARRALELASEEALRLGHDHVVAGHVLLGLVRGSAGVAAQVLYKLGAHPDGVRREMSRALEDSGEADVERINDSASLSYATGFRTRVEGLVVHARCGVADEERTLPQALRVDLNYLYEEGEGLRRVADCGTVIESVAKLLEQEEFRLLETGAQMIGEHVLDEFLPIREVTVTIAKLRVPTTREVLGVSVEATFGR